MDYRLPDWLEYPSYAYELKERLDATEVNWKPIPTMAMHISRFVDGPDMDEVYPGILLGDCDAAMNEKYLLSNGVTHVLNCAANFKGGPACVKTGPDYYKDPSITYHGLELIDLPFANITPHFEPGAAFIEKALQAGGRILVHCRQGRSRSASILIAFLMKKRNFTAANALVMLKEAREINPNSGFLKELADLDLKLFREKFQKWRELSSSESSSDSSSDEENIRRRRKSPSENTKRNRILRAKLREQFTAIIPKNDNNHKLKHEVALNKVTNSPKLTRKGIANSPNRKTASSPKPIRKVGESPNRKTANSPSRKVASSPKQARKEENSPKARKNSIKEPEPAPPKQIIIPPPAKQYDDIIWSPSPSPPPTPTAPCTVGGLLMALARVGKTGNSNLGVESPLPTPIEEESPKAQENKSSSNLIQNAVVDLKESSESAIVLDVSKCKSITRTLASKDIEVSQPKEFNEDNTSEIEVNSSQIVDVTVDVNVKTDVSYDFTFDLENNKAHCIKPYKRTSSTTNLTIIQSNDGTSGYTKPIKNSTDTSNSDVEYHQSLNSSKLQSSIVNHEVISTNTSNIPVHDNISNFHANELDSAVKQMSDIAASKSISAEHFNELDNAVDEVGDIAASMMNNQPPTQSKTIYTDSTLKDSSNLTLKNSDLNSSSQSFTNSENDNDEKQTKSAVNILSHVLSDAVILNGLPSEYDNSEESEKVPRYSSPEKSIKSITAKNEENNFEKSFENKLYTTTYSSISSGTELKEKDTIDDEKSAQKESVNANPAPSGWRKISKVITPDSWKNISLPLAPAPWKSKIESKGEVKSPSSNNKNFPQIQQSGPKGWKSVITNSSPGSSRQSPASSRETSICRTRPSSPNKSTEQSSSSPVALSKLTIFNSFSDSGEKTPVKHDIINKIPEEQRSSSKTEFKSNANISQYQRSTSVSNTNIKDPQTTTHELEVTKETSTTPSPQNERRRATCPEIHDNNSLTHSPSKNKDNHLSKSISDTKNHKYFQSSSSPEKVKQQASPSPEKSRRNSSPSPDTKRRPSSPSPDPEPTKHRGSSPTNRRSRARQRPTGASSITEKKEASPTLNKWHQASDQCQTSPVNTINTEHSSNTDSTAEVSSPGMNRYRPVSGQQLNSSEKNEIRRRPSATEESPKENSIPVLSRWRPNSRQRPTSPTRSSSTTRRRPSLTESNTSTTNTVTGVRRRTSFNDKTSTTQEITHPVQLRWRPGSVQRSTSPVRSSSVTRRRPPAENNMSNQISSNSDSISRKQNISNTGKISTETSISNDTTNSEKSYNTSTSASDSYISNTTKGISGISEKITDQVDTKPPHISSELTTTQPQGSSLSRSDSWRSRRRAISPDESAKKENQVDTKPPYISSELTTTQPQTSSLSRSDSWRSRRRAISPDESAKKENQTNTSNNMFIPRTSNSVNKDSESINSSNTYSPQSPGTSTTRSSRRPSSPELMSSRFRSNSLQRPSSPESKPRWRSTTRDRPASPARSYISPRTTSPEYTSRYSSTNYLLSNSNTVTAIGNYRLRSVSRNRASSPDRSRPRGRPTSPTAFSQTRLRSVSRNRAVSPERSGNYPSQRSSLASYGLAKSSSVTNLSMTRRFPATASILGSSTRNYSFTGSRYDSCSNLDRLDTNVERLRYKRN